MNNADMLMGFLIGLFVAGVMAISARDMGRDECEKNLSRTEKCVQQWVPVKAAAKAERSGI